MMEIVTKSIVFNNLEFSNIKFDVNVVHHNDKNYYSKDSLMYIFCYINNNEFLDIPCFIKKICDKKDTILGGAFISENALKIIFNEFINQNNGDLYIDYYYDIWKALFNDNNNLPLSQKWDLFSIWYNEIKNMPQFILDFNNDDTLKERYNSYT